MVAAADDKSDVATVTYGTSATDMVEISDVETILRETYSLNSVTDGSTTATSSHALLIEADSSSFNVGDNTLSVTITDTAGNYTTATTSLSVVSKRTNRNFLLFPGTNYVGLALIPDDGVASTTDDAAFSRLMKQNVNSSVSTTMQSDFNSGATLGDIVTSVNAYGLIGSATTNAFMTYAPGAPSNSLENLAPFQGMIFKIKEQITSATSSATYDVFNKVSVSGFTAKQAVPVKMNIEGVFFDPDSTPPMKQLEIGYNLVAPHILTPTTFDTVYRGALIPLQLAASAIGFERRVDPDGSTSGSIGVEIFEGFVVESLGGTMKPNLAYWTFIVRDDNTNPTRPVITP